MSAGSHAPFRRHKISAFACVAAALSMLIGCESSRPIELTSLGTTRWATFKKWERKHYRLLGITLDVPNERHGEDMQQDDSGEPKIAGTKNVSFGLHAASRGLLHEASTKIAVIVTEYTPEEFAEFLRGERGCFFPIEYSEARKLQPSLYTKRNSQGISYRKDYKKPDGSVIIATALNRTGAGYGHGTEFDAEDDAAIRRILESVRFTK